LGLDGRAGRHGGQIVPGFKLGGDDLVALVGEDVGQRLYRLAISARDRVHARIVRHRIDCDLRAGHVHLAAKKEDFEHFRHEVAFNNRMLGANKAVLLSHSEVGQYVNVEGYHGAVFVPEGGHLHPLKYARGLARAAETAGATLFEASRALSVTDGAQAVVRTARGSVTARTVFLACDAEMADLSPAAGRYTMPVLNYIIATEPLGEQRATELIPSNAAVSDSRFVLNYFRLSADNRLLFAGGEKYSPKPPRDIAAFVRPYMLKLFPQLADARIDYAWGGAVGITVNRLPHIGRSGNILFAHGYSGQGVLLTTLVGELVAELLKGESRNFDMFDTIPHRAFPGGKLLRSPTYVAGMLYSAMMDRL
ncbi:MAG: FAD-binding oxidoreductase, partial [Sphingomonadaceae bacterium]|nr:FAD-binding oxidoreductase [Sphingomonadaceae bacterium]